MAFCNQCGTHVEDTAQICPACGAKIYRPENAQGKVTPPVQTVVSEPMVSSVSANGILIKGIIGLALSDAPFASIAGIILSALAKKEAGIFEREHGMIFGKAKAGRILGKIGFIVGIIMTIFWPIYFVFYGWYFSEILKQFY